MDGKSEDLRLKKINRMKELFPEVFTEGKIDFDKTENVFIEGENLEVLKVLQKSYYNKIKMIYIEFFKR